MIPIVAMEPISANYESSSSDPQCALNLPGKAGQEPSPPSIQRAGFVGILGRPNVGKSTLLNRILGESLAIASPRPQTTRQRLLGVITVGTSQLALIDTPGVHRVSGQGRTLLNRFMVDEALQVLQDVDVVIAVADLRTIPAAQAETENTLDLLSREDRYLLELLPQNKPVLLALNKIDLLPDKRWLLPILQAWQQKFPFQQLIPISAKTGEGIDRLLHEIAERLPEGPALFESDVLTDRTERFLAAERIREQVFWTTQQEVPYAVAVTIDAWEEQLSEDPAHPNVRTAVRIDATIHVEKSTQKRILVGRAGRMIQEIGTRARRSIAQWLGCRVQLYLFIRVDENWSQTTRGLREMGSE